jgi:metal-sulfur cluster biosynthetic enzyme
MTNQNPDIDFEAVRMQLTPVKDPEIGMSIIDLGLVYGHEWDPKTHKLKVIMTLTSQMCPMGPEIITGVKMMGQQMPGVREVEVELVWDPPWDPRTHCSEDAKAFLGIWD